MFYEFCFIATLVYIIFRLKHLEEKIDKLYEKYAENAKVQLVIMESQLSVYSLVEGISNVLKSVYNK